MNTIIWKLRFMLRVIQRAGWWRSWAWSAAWAEMVAITEIDDFWRDENPVWTADECLSYWQDDGDNT